jgi:hypothetical protein
MLNTNTNINHVNYEEKKSIKHMDRGKGMESTGNEGN